MNKIINIHADDYGIDSEISDNIISSINYGLTNSISIVCNTKAFTEDIKKLRKLDKNIRKSIHLNLVEGFPLSEKSEVYMIVDEDGEFKYSFTGLWLKYLLSPRKKRIELIEQIKLEIENQIKIFLKYSKNTKKLNIDSHMHLHMIPFVFNIIISLSKIYKIQFVRIPYEINYYSYKTFPRLFNINIIKHLLLNSLSKVNIHKLKKHKIKHNEYFIGVLATGSMSIDDVKFALEKINKRNNPKSIDILFHPGGIKSENSVDWTNNLSFKNYYASKNRYNELNLLFSNRLKDIVNHYEIIFNHR
tara:strand:- start:179 stop:1087 length:909 start_codon:yes stop_codon:yes gene_type:complete